MSGFINYALSRTPSPTWTQRDKRHNLGAMLYIVLALVSAIILYIVLYRTYGDAPRHFFDQIIPRTITHSHPHS